MRIGELAERAELSRDTIRFYEREGLIESDDSTESTNDYREYPEELVERLAMITQARLAGFSVADLKDLFGHLDDLEKDPRGAERFLDEKMMHLRQLVARSRRLLMILRKTKAALARPPRRRPQ